MNEYRIVKYIKAETISDALSKESDAKIEVVELYKEDRKGERLDAVGFHVDTEK